NRGSFGALPKRSAGAVRTTAAGQPEGCRQPQNRSVQIVPQQKDAVSRDTSGEVRDRGTLEANVASTPGPCPPETRSPRRMGWENAMRVLIGAAILIAGVNFSALAQQPGAGTVPVGTVQAERRPIAKTAD